MAKRSTIHYEIDQQIGKLKSIEDIAVPPYGWVRAIRGSLGMSLRQLGKRMGITPQSVKEIEDRERNDAVSIKVMKQVGQALGMKFVYGFIPSEKNLDAMIQKRAREMADDIIFRTHIHKHLKTRGSDADDLLREIVEKTNELRSKMPSSLWD